MPAKELEEEINRIKNSIILLANPIRILLFGSATTSGAAPRDLDFLIIVSDHNSKMIQKQVAAGVERKQWPLDLIILPVSFYEKRKALQGSLCNIAVNEGIVLYERASS